MSLGLRKLATWLFLTAYTLSGVAHARQLVVCLEPDGTVALELSTLGECAPCGDSEQVPAGEQGLQCCPCIDIPLVAHGERAALRVKTAAAHDFAPSFDQLGWTAVLASSEPQRASDGALDPPRPAPGLALIRTVVLRV